MTSTDRPAASSHDSWWAASGRLEPTLNGEPADQEEWDQDQPAYGSHDPGVNRRDRQANQSWEGGRPETRPAAGTVNRHGDDQHKVGDTDLQQVPVAGPDDEMEPRLERSLDCAGDKHQLGGVEESENGEENTHGSGSGGEKATEENPAGEAPSEHIDVAPGITIDSGDHTGGGDGQLRGSVRRQGPLTGSPGAARPQRPPQAPPRQHVGTVPPRTLPNLP